MISCCWNCFEDEELIEIIKARGAARECALCGKRRACSLSIEELNELFSPLVSLYGDVVDFLPMDLLKEEAHPTLADILFEDWEIFKDYDTAEKFARLSCFDDQAGYGSEDEWFGHNHPLLEKLVKDWQSIAREVQSKNRFFAKRELLEHVGDVLETATMELRANTTLFRARRSKDGDPIPSDRMGAPSPHDATAGRANPHGIPYLYLASTKVTAASELRPHVGDTISMGVFHLEAKKRLVDLRSPRVGSPFRHGRELDAVIAQSAFLQKLGDALSRPVSPDSELHDYLPTQFLSEYVKVLGYDGVAYRSGVSEGFNVALFDCKGARCLESNLYTVRSVQINIEEQRRIVDRRR